LILRGVVDDVGHQHGQQLGHSIDATSEGPIWRGASWRPASLAGGVYPMPGDRVNHIENAQLVGRGGLLEVGVDCLDENGFILRGRVSLSSAPSQE
jgi:predicted sugar kinase